MIQEIAAMIHARIGGCTVEDPKVCNGPCVSLARDLVQRIRVTVAEELWDRVDTLRADYNAFGPSIEYINGFEAAALMVMLASQEKGS